MEFTIEDLEKVIFELNLGEQDEMFNVRMPEKSCEICGGHGIKAWDDQDSVLCDCLISTDMNRKMMPFGLLWKLNNLKKREVYNE